MSKSNNKKKRTDGTIPMKGKNVATPLKSNNSSASLDNNFDREHIDRVSKTNQFY
ncbi:MAG: hypothetical protein HUJ77_00535 [Clostridium sp.]|uniref:hypothetical protein n=1 Tax=Clostridium sp. TaxID=1506 RepID=UPI0025BBD94E|nr:hypothetical protein [Clostridium sp.]MCF0146862.1 hypothetical protein [Clostridium sp.]